MFVVFWGKVACVCVLLQVRVVVFVAEVVVECWTLLGSAGFVGSKYSATQMDRFTK